MTWTKSRQGRQRDQQNYGSAEYRRNRPIAMRRDGWRCQLRYDGCAGAASQCDHIMRPEDGGGHDLANLRAVCKPCHMRRTAGQGGGFRQTADPEPRSKTAW